jgi:hypothetical protein
MQAIMHEPAPALVIANVEEHKFITIKHPMSVSRVSMMHTLRLNEPDQCEHQDTEGHQTFPEINLHIFIGLLLIMAARTARAVNVLGKPLKV